MQIAKWIIFTYILLSALAQIAMIGEPRKPITRGSAMVGVIVLALMALWVYNQ